ncbi:hypothetical protein [Streptomyces sp. 6-11-2]|uniref:hypothetical protein n=1 Tax=Streptomyces sp. 6-11-2 TaxID=2585753 RepID=UPI00114335B5|nr:hypothetical protein [Streptomyces sp. 6-11-2]
MDGDDGVDDGRSEADSAGRGAKGQRFYVWAVIDLAEVEPGPPGDAVTSRDHGPAITGDTCD